MWNAWDKDPLENENNENRIRFRPRKKVGDSGTPHIGDIVKCPVYRGVLISRV